MSSSVFEDKHKKLNTPKKKKKSETQWKKHHHNHEMNVNKLKGFSPRRCIIFSSCQSNCTHEALLPPAGAWQHFTSECNCLQWHQYWLTDWLQSTSGKFDSFFISRSACVCSLSTDCRLLYRWWWGRCSPARRRARWRKARCCSSPLRRNPLNKTNDFIRCPLTGKSVKLCVFLTPEQFDVVHAGYCYLLLLLFLIFFLFTPDHRQFEEFQGNDIVVICEPESRTCIQKTPWWSNFRHRRVYLPERSPVKAVAPK